MIKKLRYLKYYSKVLLNNWRANKESYAQHHEDKLIELLLPEGVNNFIDIGANDGVLFSNTYKFAKKGAKGLCIEPSSSAYRKLRLNHIFHKKVKCVNAAISNKNGKIFLNEDGYESTLSTVTNKESHKSNEVTCYTFDEILNKNSDLQKIDLLSIDVEGHEKEVIEGIKNNQFYAKIVILEIDKCNLSTLSNLNALKNHTAKYTNGMNTFFLNKNLDFPYIDNLPEGFLAC